MSDNQKSSKFQQILRVIAAIGCLGFGLFVLVSNYALPGFAMLAIGIFALLGGIYLSRSDYESIWPSVLVMGFGLYFALRGFGIIEVHWITNLAGAALIAAGTYFAYLAYRQRR